MKTSGPYSGSNEKNPKETDKNLITTEGQDKSPVYPHLTLSKQFDFFPVPPWEFFFFLSIAKKFSGKHAKHDQQYGIFSIQGEAK